MDTIRNILELIYFISGPALLIVAIYALRQIKEARNQVQETRKARLLSAKRESYKIAADKCSYYMETVIPLMNILDKEIDSKKVTYFEKSVVTKTSNSYKLKPANISKEEKETLFSLPITEVFNPLESFSLFFTSGVADEKVGYLTLGHTFCESVDSYLPILIMLSSDQEHYNNIMQLFTIWNTRKEREKLEADKQRIEKAISDKREITIKPIGTTD